MGCGTSRELWLVASAPYSTHVSPLGAGTRLQRRMWSRSGGCSCQNVCSAGALDAVVCIAVLHHISSERRRVRLLHELARVLRPGGRALVTVWASQQEEPGKLQKWEPIPSGQSLAHGLTITTAPMPLL